MTRYSLVSAAEVLDAHGALLVERVGVPGLLRWLRRYFSLTDDDIATLFCSQDLTAGDIDRFAEGVARPTSTERGELGRAVALCCLLLGAGVTSPVGWLNAPLVEGWLPTRMWLWQAYRVDLLLAHARGELTGAAALECLDPEWRTRWWTRWEVEQLDDGGRRCWPRADGAREREDAPA